jgi:hypothetical protein
MRGHRGDRKSRVIFRRRFGAAAARDTARQALSPKSGTDWRAALLALLSLVRLAQDEPGPSASKIGPPAAPVDAKITAEVELLLSQAARERAEASKAEAQAAYWRKRADQAGEEEQLSGADPGRVGLEVKREELEIESLELGNLGKLVGLGVTLGGLAAGIVITALGGGHLGGLEQELLSWINRWGRF